jgi:signal transduction histidine kinase
LIQGGVPLVIRLVGQFGTIECQPNKLGYVFRNLLKNAMDHALTVPTKVTIRHELRLDRHHFEVRDNGRGVPPAYRRSIFLPFRRGPSSQGDGLGLGLALAKQIVEQHGGEISLADDGGTGAIFRFTIAGAQPGRTAIDG